MKRFHFAVILFSFSGALFFSQQSVNLNAVSKKPGSVAATWEWKSIPVSKIGTDWTDFSKRYDVPSGTGNVMGAQFYIVNGETKFKADDAGEIALYHNRRNSASFENIEQIHKCEYGIKINDAATIELEVSGNGEQDPCRIVVVKRGKERVLVQVGNLENGKKVILKVLNAPAGIYRILANGSRIYKVRIYQKVEPVQAAVTLPAEEKTSSDTRSAAVSPSTTVPGSDSKQAEIERLQRELEEVKRTNQELQQKSASQNTQPSSQGNQNYQSQQNHQNQQQGIPMYSNPYGYQNPYYGGNMPPAGSPELFYEVDRLIMEDYKANEPRIRALAAGLDINQRQTLLVKHEKSGALPFCLNLFVGFGLGSFIQGDKKSGSIQLAWEIGGLVLMWGGIAVNTATGSAAGMSLMAFGSGAVLGSCIGGCIVPWIYANTYNENLGKTLNGIPPNLSFAPIVNPAAKTYGFSAKVSL